MAMMQNTSAQDDTSYNQHAALHGQPQSAASPAVAPKTGANSVAPIQDQGGAANNAPAVAAQKNQTKTTADKPQFVPPQYSHHVYGGSAAFEIRTSETKADEPKNTVSFDFAKKLQAKKYDWKNKLVFQATQTELFDLCALFLGVKAEAKFDFHDGKTMFVKWQPDGNLVLNVVKGEQKFAVPVSTGFDRIACFNACLYSLALEMRIPRSEARAQVMSISRPTPNFNPNA